MEDRCKSEIYLCSCRGEGLKVEKWDKDEIYMAFWQCGLFGKYPLSIWERLRFCWHTLRTGRVWADEVVMTDETARMLGKYLMSLTEVEQVEESEPLYYKTCLYCMNFIRPQDTLCPRCGENQID